MSDFLDGFQPERVFAWRDGMAIGQGEFLSDVLAVAERLPERPYVLALCDDRYNFLVSFGAALLRGQVSLFSHSYAPGALKDIAASYPDLYATYDRDSHGLDIEAVPIRVSGGSLMHGSVPSFAPETMVAIAFTSGSTGKPRPTPKNWRALAAGAQALERRVGRPKDQPMSVVATIPSGHSYGIETTVMPPLLSGTSIEASRPLFPADVVAALARVSAPRCLVTTPIHLRALVASSVCFPQLDLVICATAPLNLALAQKAEARLGARLLEIYGCTESGFVATRWTTDGGPWLIRDDMTLRPLDTGYAVTAEFLPEAVPLADIIERLDDRSFNLTGRTADIVNIAGKRASLEGLSRILLAIEGVEDAVFVVPESEDLSSTNRLAALAVAPTLTLAALRRHLLERIDPAFMPRQIKIVDRLPRNETGKLLRDRLTSLLKSSHA